MKERERERERKKGDDCGGCLRSGVCRWMDTSFASSHVPSAESEREKKKKKKTSENYRRYLHSGIWFSHSIYFHPIYPLLRFPGKSSTHTNAKSWLRDWPRIVSPLPARMYMEILRYLSQSIRPAKN